jgi:sugar phosphate isomerase/epimerase
MRINRRDFLAGTAAAGILPASLRGADKKAKGMRLGLVTYEWAKDMDLPTLIAVCEKSGLLGVELRTEHKHGVEPSLTKEQRKEVRKRFADSPVTLVGYGSNCEYHAADPAKVRENIELTKQYIHLMHDCGATGVKVKPNAFPPNVPREKTIEQIGKALNEVGAYGANYGQKIRVEVHGRGTSELPVMKAIFDVATHPNVYVCWNSNPEDLKGEGLEANFNMVKGRLGDTAHIRQLNSGDYPYDRLLKLFKGINYDGWLLLEARPALTVDNRVEVMAEQLRIFEQMLGRS